MADQEQAPAQQPPGASEFEQVYARLRRIAGRLMQRERPGHTLWPTEVVNETMARLLEAGNLGEELPLSHTIARAARVMQQVLIEHARRRGASKRGGGMKRISLEEIDDFEAAIESPEFNWSALERALTEMESQDPRRHEVVMLRFFGGLSNQQIAEQLGIELRTVGRDWAAARLWLKQQLRSEG